MIFYTFNNALSFFILTLFSSSMFVFLSLLIIARFVGHFDIPALLVPIYTGNKDDRSAGFLRGLTHLLRGLRNLSLRKGVHQIGSRSILKIKRRQLGQNSKIKMC